VANTGAAANTGTPANTGTATGTAATTVTAAEPANDTGADPRVDGSTPDAEPPVTFALAVCEPDLHCAP
jgi:hypothetical protein